MENQLLPPTSNERNQAFRKVLNCILSTETPEQLEVTEKLYNNYCNLFGFNAELDQAIRDLRDTLIREFEI